MQLGYLISWLHPILVHFPIALLLTALVAEFTGWWSQHSALSSAAKILLVSGCVISLFAFVTGNFAEVFAVRGGTAHDPVDRHGLWAMWTTWLFIGLTIVRCYLQPTRGSRAFKIYLAGLFLASCALGYTGHQGGQLVFDHGANVLARHEGHAIDMRDLKDLYQEQNIESITYSEMMHHIFGWLVLAMSLFLIFSKIWPDRTRTLWRGGPFVLLAGGAFLMIFSDTDSWPLSNARPIYDKEVLQHKIFASLMITAGCIGLFRRRRVASAAPSASYQFGMALLSLVGGGLLFTHVHSVAPYSNRAVGVYLHHLTMGFVALTAGVAIFWESLGGNGSRWKTFLWPSVLIIESILLINYNENIPWFVRPFLGADTSLIQDAHYQLELETKPSIPSADGETELRFTLYRQPDRHVVRDLEIVHENPLHLMIVSEDLSYFDHIHPVQQPDGSLLLRYRFPYGGNFLLFSDLLPKGASAQSYRIPIRVTGNEPARQPIAETAYETVRLRGHQVLLFTQPIILAPGQPSVLRFGVYDEQDKGIGDLQPYLGCFGHCIVVSEDTKFYLHTHPAGHKHGAIAVVPTQSYLDEPVFNATDGLPQLGKKRAMMYSMGMSSPSMNFSGPEVSFEAIFPRSGLYKVWAQFKHHDEILTAPFVVRVP